MEEESESESDRISQLPDEILQHILSLIDIKQAVQTSILSQRWQNLWSSMSDLRFNFTLFATHLNNLQAGQDLSHRFQLFVSNFLSHRHHTSTIRKFHLSLDVSVAHAPPPFIEKCVGYAVAHGVETLHLHALCALELRHHSYGVHLPENVSLPLLKTLYLESTFFTDDGELYTDSKEPFSRFPELEKLTLRRCVIHGLVIIGPKLRVLEIIQDEFSHKYNRMEKIWTPMLALFRYEAFLPLECSNINFPMLEETYVNILIDENVEGKWKTLRCVQMLQHLGNAAIVTLTFDTLKALEMDRDLIEQSPWPFPNMKCLRLRRGHREILRVQKRVVDYLRGGLCGESLMVEFPEGVTVIEEDDDDDDDDFDELELKRLFVW